MILLFFDSLVHVDSLGFNRVECMECVEAFNPWHCFRSEMINCSCCYGEEQHAARL